MARKPLKVRVNKHGWENALKIANRQAFAESARFQRVCAMCGKGGPHHAHHVFYEQHLRQRGLPKHHAMNALRLCPTCHERHHKGVERIPVRKLHHDNLLYLFDMLGAAALDYLNTNYDHREQDPRVVELLEKANA